MNKHDSNSDNKQHIYYHISGTVCLIGHGLIGKGFIPLLKKHFTYDKFVIVDPINIPAQGVCDKFYKISLLAENYAKILDQIFLQKKGFVVNVSVYTDSKSFISFCQQRGILYIDTIKEGWEGVYVDKNISMSMKSNYRFRHDIVTDEKLKKNKTTAISCCGANPGMVGWFVKKALMDIAKDTDFKLEKQPQTREQWARLMMNLGVKGIHVAERDTQKTNKIRPIGHFWNTWSVYGLIIQGLFQSAEMGLGTHQKWLPSNAMHHEFGNKCAIYFMQSGLNTMVKSWCPTPGPQMGYMISHDESISIADYYTVQVEGKVLYRPTCFFAYHPCEDAINSCLDIIGSGISPPQQNWKILNQKDIISGADELGVLIYGHGKNAYWYGSQLSIQKTKELIGDQNATALQVTSAILAGMVWALQNPEAGLVETNEMDYKRCLEIQTPYIEPLIGVYTNWNPLDNCINNFENDAFDLKDPWQLKNILVNNK